MDAVRRNRTEKMKKTTVVSLHDNAPAHRLILVKEFLAKNSVTTLEHSPNNPDLGPATFYLFPRQKSALKERRLCDATDIINNATKELKRLSQEGFQKCIQHFYSAGRSAQLHKGAIFKKCHLTDCTDLCFSQKSSDSLNTKLQDTCIYIYIYIYIYMYV
jgi:hypothetical protein